MKVVILSVCAAVDVYLIQRLASATALHVVRVVHPSVRQPMRLASVRKLTPRNLFGRLEQLFYGWYWRRSSRQTCRLLFHSSKPPPLRIDRHVEASRLNDPETVHALRELAPDILLLSGAPVVGEALLAVPKIATINVHYGVAPQYRGENTIFWPLYKQDHEMIGVTLHLVTKRVDGGPILATGWPALAQHDSEATLFAKCARLAAEMLFDILISPLNISSAGAAQQAAGRLYLRRERRLWHDARYLLARALRGRLLPETSARVLKY